MSVCVLYKIYKLNKIARKPQISIQHQYQPENINFLILNIKNVGQTVAKNVEISLTSAPIDGERKMLGITFDPIKLATLGPQEYSEKEIDIPPVQKSDGEYIQDFTGSVYAIIINISYKDAGGELYREDRVININPRL